MHAMSQDFVPWTASPRASAASTCGRPDGDRGVADEGDAAPAPGLQRLPGQPTAVDAVLRDGVRVGGAVQHRLEAQRHVVQPPLGGLQMARYKGLPTKISSQSSGMSSSIHLAVCKSMAQTTYGIWPRRSRVCVFCMWANSQWALSNIGAYHEGQATCLA